MLFTVPVIVLLESVMNKFFRVICDLFYVLFLVGAYLIQTYTMRKLGMNRWVAYHQMKAKSMLPVDVLRYVVPLVLLLVVVFLWMQFRKQKRRSVGRWAAMILLSLTEVFYLGFTLLMNGTKVRAYYMVLPLIGLSVLMMIFRNLIRE